MQTIRKGSVYLACFLVLCIAHSSRAGTILFGTGVDQFSMDFVLIGSPGNPDDSTGAPNPVGSVGYSFQMGTYEVSRDMIVKANALGGLGITLSDMTGFGGNGSDKPATGVSWNEAARFVNWLNTSSGGYAAYKFTTSGVNDNIALWTAADVLDYDPLNPFRSKRSNYVLPSVDEWYKAAFYNPITASYSDFANGLDTAPTPVASGTASGTAVYQQDPSQGPADITQAGGLSPFGVMGLGGNVLEWNETSSFASNTFAPSPRIVRGGMWFNGPSFLSSSVASPTHPMLENPLFGFRVASLAPVAAVPEPFSLLLWSVMCAGGWLYRKRLLPSPASDYRSNS